MLIADDDAIVRMKVSSMIDWEGLELSLAACVANGKEAVAYMDKNPVDILITDIQMPVTDGLELIRYANKMEMPPQILVLSAYNDFPYVRQAFRLGIYDYCLKRDIFGETLGKHLMNMKQMLFQSGRIQNAKRSEMPDRKDLLIKLLHGEIEAKEADLPEYYYIVYFSIRDWNTVQQKFGNDFAQLFQSSLINLANQIFQIAKHGTIVPENVTSLAMVYEARAQHDLEQECFDEILRVCERLLKAWKNYMNVDMMAAVSDLAEGADEFEERLVEAAMNLTMRYVMRSKNLFSSRDYMLFSPQEAGRQAKNHEKIIQALKTGNFLHFESEKSSLLAKMQESELSYARHSALYLAYNIISSIVHQAENADCLCGRNLQHELSELKSNQEVCIWTVNFLCDIKQYVQLHYQLYLSDEISRAVDYINNHFYDANLTLYEVAGEVGFSEKYFSSLFNKKMGMSFSNYMKELRVNYAKKMLDESSMKLKEISEAVGYNSVEYFIRVFSSMEGMGPSAYRKRRHTIVQ